MISDSFHKTSLRNNRAGTSYTLQHRQKSGIYTNVPLKCFQLGKHFILRVLVSFSPVYFIIEKNSNNNRITFDTSDIGSEKT